MPVHTDGSGDPLGRLPRQVAPDRIIRIERHPYAGHVYNLVTEQGWFTADGIIVHNCGTFLGGSALFFAHLLDIVGGGRVLTIDPRDDDPARAWPRHPRITYLQGSSVDPAIVAQARLATAGAGADGPVLVSLDSDHSQAHVTAELDAYAPLVTVGSYLVVEDTNLNGHPVLPTFGPGPFEAVAAWLPDHPEFEADRHRERMLVTAQPGGWLRRVR